MMRLIAGIGLLVTTYGRAVNAQAVAAPKFEVASIRPCKPGDSRPAGRSMDPNASATPGSLKNWMRAVAEHHRGGVRRVRQWSH